MTAAPGDGSPQPAQQRRRRDDTVRQIGRDGAARGLVPLETVSIVDYRYLDATTRALLKNALFYVVPDPAIEAARDHVLAQARALAEAIHTDGVRTQGISLDVDRARTEAIVAMQDLVDAVADAEPTMTARCLGIA